MGFTIFLLANGTEELRKIYSIRDISIRYAVFDSVSITGDSATIDSVSIRHAATDFSITGE